MAGLMATHQTTLRDLLQQITHEASIAKHSSCIEELRATFEHSISVLTTEKGNRAYNCVMYALGIESSAEYFAMSTHCPENVHASTDFLHFLYDSGTLIERHNYEQGCLVTYSHERRFRHIGRVVDGGLVRSKWGIGNLYEHQLLEVPATYGTEIRLFDELDTEDVLNAFYQYAQKKGVVFT